MPSILQANSGVSAKDIEGEARVAVVAGEFSSDTRANSTYTHGASFTCRFSAPGSDNIAVIAALAIFFLLTRQDYYLQLQAELDSAFDDPTAPLDAEVLASLPFLNGVINETLRLGTPFFLPREIPANGAVIDGMFVPPGTVVALAVYSQHHDSKHFAPYPMVSYHD